MCLMATKPQKQELPWGFYYVTAHTLGYGWHLLNRVSLAVTLATKQSLSSNLQPLSTESSATACDALQSRTLQFGCSSSTIGRCKCSPLQAHGKPVWHILRHLSWFRHAMQCIFCCYSGNKSHNDDKVEFIWRDRTLNWLNSKIFLLRVYSESSSHLRT